MANSGWTICLYFSLDDTRKLRGLLSAARIDLCGEDAEFVDGLIFILQDRICSLLGVDEEVRSEAA